MEAYYGGKNTWRVQCDMYLVQRYLISLNDSNTWSWVVPIIWKGNNPKGYNNRGTQRSNVGKVLEKLLLRGLRFFQCLLKRHLLNLTWFDLVGFFSWKFKSTLFCTLNGNLSHQKQKELIYPPVAKVWEDISPQRTLFLSHWIRSEFLRQLIYLSNKIRWIFRTRSFGCPYNNFLL